jgi:hypothetical protein
MIRVLSGIVVGVAATVGGEIPTPTVDDPGDEEDARPGKRSGTWRCGLAVMKSSGWVHEIQVDLLHRLSSRWRGPGAIVPGAAWVGDRGLIWMPRRRESGARGFELGRGGVVRIQASPVGLRSSGLVVTSREHGEAWLLLGRDDASKRDPDRDPDLLLRLERHQVSLRVSGVTR